MYFDRYLLSYSFNNIPKDLQQFQTITGISHDTLVEKNKRKQIT